LWIFVFVWLGKGDDEWDNAGDDEWTDDDEVGAKGHLLMVASIGDKGEPLVCNMCMSTCLTCWRWWYEQYDFVKQAALPPHLDQSMLPIQKSNSKTTKKFSWQNQWLSAASNNNVIGWLNDSTETTTHV